MSLEKNVKIIIHLYVRLYSDIFELLLIIIIIKRKSHIMYYIIISKIVNIKTTYLLNEE